MEPILSSQVLESLAAADVLLAFDFDGTLAPIVSDPASAAMRGSTRRLLAQAAQLYPCAVISGRPEADVLRLLGGVTVWYVIGNRALQPPEQAQRLAEVVDGWRPVLRDRLAGHAGVAIEDKGVSLAIHYRHAADRERARLAIQATATLLQNVRVLQGKEAVNLLPADGPDKSVALERVRTPLGCPRALYVGDDAGDEDVFAMGPSVIGVRVGAANNSAARWYLHDQEEVDALLDRLVALRKRKPLCPERVRRPAAPTIG